MNDKDYIKYLLAVLEEYKARQLEIHEDTKKTYCQSCLRSFHHIHSHKRTAAQNIAEGCAYGVVIVVIFVITLLIMFL